MKIKSLAMDLLFFLWSNIVSICDCGLLA